MCIPLNESISLYVTTVRISTSRDRPLSIFYQWASMTSFSSTTQTDVGRRRLP